ncbi:MAG: hypothetical protein RLO51_22120 [Thalassobaculum sp.]|uniref:hypothetical protein n=1 Tax=Thalassobaculum sp. TaxID=2022740 RepID=UPI0032EB754A
MKPLIIASILTAAIAGSAVAQSSMSGQVATGVDQVMTRDGTRYACTGIGAESRTDPRWSGFPAKLVFAANDGGYLSQVATRIADGQGRTVFEVQDCGPWLLLDLPKGRYTVNATAHDGQGRNYESRAIMTVGAGGQTETVVRFPDLAG